MLTDSNILHKIEKTPLEPILSGAQTHCVIAGGEEDGHVPRANVTHSLPRISGRILKSTSRSLKQNNKNLFHQLINCFFKMAQLELFSWCLIVRVTDQNHPGSKQWGKSPPSRTATEGAFPQSWARTDSAVARAWRYTGRVPLARRVSTSCYLWNFGAGRALDFLDSRSFASYWMA